MAEETSAVYRQKSLDRIASPEQLTDYLRVTSPGIWVVLIAVITMLLGLVAWSIAGELETTRNGAAVVENGTAVILTSDSGGEIRSGMTVRLGKSEFVISAVETDSYGRTLAYAPVSVADGKYDVKIVTEKVHPIQFLFV
jgi:hypothetical protein